MVKGRTEITSNCGCGGNCHVHNETTPMVYNNNLTIEGEVYNLCYRMTEAEEDIKCLDSRLTTAEENITDLQTRMTAAESDIDILQTDMAQAKADITDLQGRMTTAERNIKLLQDDITVAQAQIADLQTRMSTVENNIINLTDNLTRLTARVTEAESRLTAVESRATAIERRMNMAENNISALQTDLSLVTERVVKNETAIASLQTDAEKLREDVDTANAGVNNLTSSLEDTNAQITAVKNDVAGLGTRVTDLETFKTDTTERLSEINTDIEGLSARTSTLETHDAQNSQNIAKNATDIAELTNEFEEFKSTVPAGDDYAALKGTVETHTTEIAGLDTRVSALEQGGGGGSDLEPRVEKNEQDIAALTTEVDNVSNAVDMLGQTVDNLTTDVIPGIRSDVHALQTETVTLDTRVETLENASVLTYTDAFELFPDAVSSRGSFSAKLAQKDVLLGVVQASELAVSVSVPAGSSLVIGEWINSHVTSFTPCYFDGETSSGNRVLISVVKNLTSDRLCIQIRPRSNMSANEPFHMQGTFLSNKKIEIQ